MRNKGDVCVDCGGALGGLLRLGCLVPAFRTLYWVNRGLRGRTTITSAGMDGSNRQELTVVSMEEPVGLTLDHVAGRLYWISEYKEVGMGAAALSSTRCFAGPCGQGSLCWGTGMPYGH